MAPDAGGATMRAGVAAKRQSIVRTSVLERLERGLERAETSGMLALMSPRTNNEGTILVVAPYRGAYRFSPFFHPSTPAPPFDFPSDRAARMNTLSFHPRQVELATLKTATAENATS